MSKDGYSPIPDVETGISNKKTRGDPRARYPDANDLEATFLDTLDDAIDNAKPNISLPRVASKDVGEPLSLMEFLRSLELVSKALGVTVLSALVAIFLDNPVVVALFPYYTCIVTYLASVPATRDRLAAQSEPLIGLLQKAGVDLDSRIDRTCEEGLDYIQTAERTCDAALKPIRPKLDVATRAEKTLQVIDPSIDIPDATDIERGFQGFASKIKGAFEPVRQKMNPADFVPRPLRSQSHFDRWVIYPALGVFLVVQLFCIWTSSRGIGVDGGSISDDATAPLDGTESGASRFLRGSDTSALGQDDDEEQDFLTSLLPIWFAIQTYVTSVLQLAITFITTQAAAMATAANQSISKVEGNINGELDRSVGPVYQTVFVDGFGSVRDLMLNLIKKMNKIEGPLKQLEEMDEPVKALQSAFRKKVGKLF